MDTHSVINYVPYWKSGGQDWRYNLKRPFLGLSTSCSSSSAHDVLLIWAGSAYDPQTRVRTNVTAQFCSANYYSQRVNATLVYPDFQVVSTEPVGPRSNLPETIFNATSFEYLIGLGQSATELNGDWPDITTIQQGLKVEQLDISPPYGNMVGFALGNRSFGVQDYSDPRKMQQAFEAAHQLLFRLAINQLQGQDVSQVEGKLYGKSTGIIMVPGFSIALELALVLIAISTFGVLIVNWNRHNKLQSDPASIQDFMRLLPDFDNPDPVLTWSGSSTVELRQALHNQRFRLEYAHGTRHVQTKIRRIGALSLENLPSTRDEKFASQQQALQEVRPLGLALPAGILLGFTLLTTIIILAVLLHRAHALGGLPRPSNNIIARQILINYIPTVFATILEPTWVLINRLLCTLQPFETLRACNVSAARSIALRYTSLPPQLVITRALRAKHYLLASVCTIALLANPLAIALSSIFQDSEVPQSRADTFRQLYLPQLTSIFLPYDYSAAQILQQEPLDHYYVLKSNFTDLAPLPPWTTRDLFFLPFTAESAVLGDNIHYQAGTRAFGISSTCHTIATSAAGSTELELVSNGGLQIEFTATNANDFDQASCIASSLAGNVRDPYLPKMGKNSLESIYSYENCPQSVFIAAWFRPNFTGQFDSNDRPEYSSFEYLVLSCEAQLRTAEFLTTVNKAQQIVTAEHITPFEYEMTPYLDVGVDASTIVKDLNILMSSASQDEQVAWHTDVHAREYFNAVLKPLLNGTNTDPSAPLPPASILAPLVEDLYTRIFAILLGLSPTAFVENPHNTSIQGNVIFDQHRIVMNPVMTFLAIAILSLNLLVATVLYAKRPGKWLPRMPTSIADVLAYVGSSGEIRKNLSYDEITVWGGGKRETRWGYGRFLGRDGRWKIGIERWPLVVPLTADDFKDERHYGRSNHLLSKWLELEGRRRNSSPLGEAEMRAKNQQRPGAIFRVE